MKEAEVVQIIRDLLKTLKFLHDRQIVHLGKIQLYTRKIQKSYRSKTGKHPDRRGKKNLSLRFWNVKSPPKRERNLPGSWHD